MDQDSKDSKDSNFYESIKLDGEIPPKILLEIKSGTYAKLNQIMVNLLKETRIGVKNTCLLLYAILYKITKNKTTFATRYPLPDVFHPIPDISYLNAKIDASTDDNLEYVLWDIISACTNENKSKQMSDLTSQLTETTQKLGQTNDTTEKELLQKKIAALTQQLDEAKTREGSLNYEFKELQDSFKDLHEIKESHWNEYTRHIDELVKYANQKESEFEKLRELTKFTDKTLSEKTLELEQLKNKTTDANEEEKKFLREQISQTEELKLKAINANRDAQSKAEEASKEAKHANEQLVIIKEDCARKIKDAEKKTVDAEEEQKRLAAIVEESEEKVRNAKAEEDASKLALLEANKTLDELKRTLNTKQDANEEKTELLKSIEQQKTRIAFLEGASKNRNNKINELEKSSKDAEAASLASNEQARLAALEKGKLEEINTKIQAELTELQRKTTNLEGRLVQIQSNKNTMEKTHKEHITEIEAALTQSKKETELANLELQQERLEKVAVEDKLSAAEAAMLAAKRNSNNLSSTKEELQEERYKIAGLNQQLDKATQSIEAAKEEKNQSALKTQMLLSEAEEAHKQEFNQKTRELQNTIDMLHKNHEAEISLLINKKENAINQLNALNKNKDEMDAQYRNELQSAKASYQSNKEEKTKLIETLKKKIEDARSEINNAESKAASATAELSETKNQYDQEKKNYESLLADVTAKAAAAMAAADKAKADADNAVRESNEKDKDVAKAVEERERTNAQLNDAKVQLEEALQNVETSQATIANLQSDVQVALASSNESKAKEATALAAFKAAEESLATFQAEQDAARLKLAEQTEQLEQQLHQLENTLKNTEEQMNAAKANATVARGETAELNEKLIQLEREKNSAEAKATAAEANASDATAKAVAAQALLEEAESKAAEANASKVLAEKNAATALANSQAAQTADANAKAAAKAQVEEAEAKVVVATAAQKEAEAKVVVATAAQEKAISESKQAKSAQVQAESEAKEAKEAEAVARAKSEMDMATAENALKQKVASNLAAKDALSAKSDAERRTLAAEEASEKLKREIATLNIALKTKDESLAQALLAAQKVTDIKTILQQRNSNLALSKQKKDELEKQLKDAQLNAEHSRLKASEYMINVQEALKKEQESKLSAEKKLKEVIQSHEENIRTIDEEATKKIISLNRDLAAAQSEAALLDQQLKNEQTGREGNRDAFKKKGLTAQAMFDKLLISLENAHQKVFEAGQEIKTVKNESEKEIQKLKASVDTEKNNFEKLANAFDTLQSENTTISILLDQQNEQLGKLVSKSDAIEEELKLAQESLTIKEKELSQKEKELYQLLRNHNVSRDEFSKLKISIQSLRSQVAASEEEKNKLTKAAEEYKANYDATKKEITTINAIAAAETKAREEADKKASESELKLRTLQEDKDNIDRAVEFSKNKLDIMMESLKLEEEKIDVINKESAKTLELLREAEAKYAAAQTMIQSIQANKNLANQQTTQEKQLKEQAENEASSAKVELDSAKKKNDELSVLLTTKESELAEHAKQAEKANQEVSELKREKELTEQTLITEYKTRIQQAHDRIIEIKTKVDDILKETGNPEYQSLIKIFTHTSDVKNTVNYTIDLENKTLEEVKGIVTDAESQLKNAEDRLIEAMTIKELLNSHMFLIGMPTRSNDDEHLEKSFENTKHRKDKVQNENIEKIEKINYNKMMNEYTKQDKEFNEYLKRTPLKNNGLPTEESEEEFQAYLNKMGITLGGKRPKRIKLKTKKNGHKSKVNSKFNSKVKSKLRKSVKKIGRIRL